MKKAQVKTGKEKLEGDIFKEFCKKLEEGVSWGDTRAMRRRVENLPESKEKELTLLYIYRAEVKLERRDEYLKEQGKQATSPLGKMIEKEQKEALLKLKESL